MFDGWETLRVDIDPNCEPDIVASIIDMAQIPTGYVDAVWATHSVEHLFWHEVGVALAEFYRILADDGFACLVVPDLQAIGELIATDRMHEPIYVSASGPVTAHDMVFGFGTAIGQGRISMAHRCGFTPSLMLRRLNEVPFEEIIVRRRPNLELAAVARKRRSRDTAEREALLAGLEL